MKLVRPLALGVALGAIAATFAPSPAHAAPTPLDVLGTVASRDNGVPTFIWASRRHQPRAPITVSRQPADMARWYLNQYAPLYGLTPAAIATAVVHDVHDTGRGGIIVTFHQRVAGIDVLHTRIAILLRRNLELVALAGRLHPIAVATSDGARRRGPAFALTPAQALARSFADLYRVPVNAARVSDTGARKAGYHYLDLLATGAAAGLRLTEPARVKPVLYPTPRGLVSAYYTELSAGRAAQVTSDFWAHVVAADDGRVLSRRDLTDNESFDYTVWAETDGAFTPLYGPQEDFTPHPTGVPDGSQPAFIPPVVISMEGFNTNPEGGVDPWLPAGATETTGNNVEAYADLLEPDGFSEGDIRGQITSPGVFGWIYDTALEPLDSESQSRAAITQIFYVTNWLHDFFYDSGFDEAAGNAQDDNFGRGGVDADSMKAEAQDGALEGRRNNASMSTPADGARPRMQMFLFRGQDIQRELTALNTTFETETAAFGARNFDITADIAVVDDGVGATTDACEALSSGLAGRIAFIDRGDCTFANKTLNAQQAGAIAVIIANNVPGDGPMAMSGSNTDITIPVLSVSFEDGEIIEAAARASAVTATMLREVDVERDATIDNSIIAHEWGHYIHRRLVPCGNRQCGAISEGWGDFLALHMDIREGDDLDGAWAKSVYATGDPYFGIRRVPYSVNTDFNALSLRHISDDEALPTNHPIQAFGPNSEVHNAGEIWAVMMLEAYVALLRETTQPDARRTFDEAKRVMADYIVAGLKLTAVDSTYTEQRDGILAAALAADEQDFLVIAEAFARRGAGSCAVSPERGSTNFDGVVESFEIGGSLELVTATLDDSVDSCDDDGVLDADESGQLNLVIRNAGVFELSDATLSISSATEGIQIGDGTSEFALDALPPLESFSMTLPVAFTAADNDPRSIEIAIEVRSEASCNGVVTRALVELGNFDGVANASTVDTAEARNLAWIENSQVGPGDMWSRAVDSRDPGNHVLFGRAIGGRTDVSLESPPIEVDGSDDFIISFRHRHDFEFSDNTNWDGGVVEISGDDGVWRDISELVDPGYGGPLSDLADNPLALRPAFVSRNPAYPDMDTVTLNLGSQLSGQTVRIRFRIGTDAGVGTDGWEIDDVSVQGVDNTPFPEVRDDNCPPVDGGGCCSTGSGGAGGPLGHLPLVALVAFGLLLVLRRRHAAGRAR